MGGRRSGSRDGGDRISGLGRFRATASCSVQMTRNLGQVSTGVAARALLVQRDGLQQLPWEMTVQSPVPGNSPRVTWARGTVPHSDQPREQQVSIVWC